MYAFTTINSVRRQGGIRDRWRDENGEDREIQKKRRGIYQPTGLKDPDSFASLDSMTEPRLGISKYIMLAKGIIFKISVSFSSLKYGVNIVMYIKFPRAHFTC